MIIMLKKIRSKLLASFFSIILLMSALTLAFVYLQTGMVQEYRQIIDSVIVEQNVPEGTRQLIQDYYFYVSDIKSSDKTAKYAASKAELDGILSYLDANVAQNESGIIYRGLRNVVGDIKAGLDEAVSKASEGNITGNSAAYEDANYKQNFVTDLTGALILKELEYSESVERQVNDLYGIILAAEAAVLAAVILSVVLFSLIFSSRISSPIIKLSDISKKISEGNLKLGVDRHLLERNDEIGALSNMLDKMIRNLRESIEKLSEFNKQMQDAKKDVESKNEELSKFNKMAVGRELRMVELKKKISELEETLKQKKEG